MITLNFIRRLAAPKNNLLLFLNGRNYVSQTSIRLNINQENAFATPPIISFSGIYRCSVTDPVCNLFHFESMFYFVNYN